MEKLQCSICGGSLVMSDDGDKAVCESCGMSFKKETVKKMIMELSGPVKVEGIQNSDSLAERAETFMRLGESAKAEKVFRQMTDEYPADYRGWWGLTRVTNWEQYFYKNGSGEAVMPLECQWALNFAPEEMKEEIQTYYEEQVRVVKPGTDRKLNQEAAEREKQETLNRTQQEEKEIIQQKLAIYNQAVKQMKQREENALKQVQDLELSISVLTTRIRDEKKLNNAPRTGDRRPITIGNIIALVLGGMLTFAAWVEFHPIGTPIVTLLALGLPLLFIIRRVNRTKGHFDRAGEMQQQLKQAQQDLVGARKELEDAKAASRAIQNARPN